MRIKLALVSIIVLHAGTAFAEGSVGVKVGTLGIGLEGAYKISEHWGLRGGLNQFDYDYDDDLDGVNYNGDLELSSAALLGDYRPWATGFRITGGAIFNNNEISAVADSDATYEVGNTNYTRDEVGTLSARSEFDSVAPYLGLGFDVGVSSQFSLNFDLGVLFQGEPSVRIESTGGTLSSDPGLLQDLDDEARRYEDDLEDFDLYPVLSIGFAYSFK